MKSLVAALILVLAAQTAQAKLVTRTVEYRQGDAQLEGYLAYDDSMKGKRPGILVFHEWTGIGPYVKKRVERLASLGYVAFAADLYGKGVRPATPELASAEAGKYKRDRALLRARGAAALDQLRRVPGVDSGRLAAIGYCFGGMAALELARSGAALAGVVSFHGSLDTPVPADALKIKGPVLVLHGADDPFVPPEQVQAFQTEMRMAKVDWQMIYYGGAVHSFSNPDSGSDPLKGVAYQPAADRRSWEHMRVFFAEIFKSEIVR